MQFSHIDTWIFDLDNTLYPPQAALFEQINKKMSDYIQQTLDISSENADILRHTYWRKYGSTLAGLIKEHSICKHDFLEKTHDINFNGLRENSQLKHKISTLNARKIIFTNGPSKYAQNVLTALGLNTVFDAIYAIEDTNYIPKPNPTAYEAVFSIEQINPKTAIMFEDEYRNLQVPHKMGITTVLVHSTAKCAYIDHQTNNLVTFLDEIISSGVSNP